MPSQSGAGAKCPQVPLQAAHALSLAEDTTTLHDSGQSADHLVLLDCIGPVFKLACFGSFEANMRNTHRTSASQLQCQRLQRLRCHDSKPRFHKIEGDKRVIRGKVFVCLDVRPAFQSASHQLRTASGPQEPRAASAGKGTQRH